MSGRWLGIKPDEFEYLTPPPSGVPLAVTGEGARKLMDQLMDTEERLAELLYHVSGLSERGYTAKGMKEAADDHMDRQFGYRLDDAVKDAGLPDELQVHHLGSLLERLKADPEVGNNQPEGEALSEAIDFINAIRAAAADGVKA
ncbi:MAG: hypothetical protein NCW75_05475 [Phycisphaera sp.]|nr:MAG: hypothetical protein NCW75_05475 [Phycisphaera sp.]